MLIENYCNIYILNLLLLNKKNIKLPLTGNCMKPLLNENDLITINPIPIKQLRCGDIVLYHVNENLKCHRFIKFKTIQKKKYLITKSDRRFKYDIPIPSCNFLGIVTQIRKGEKVINYESKKWKIINYCLGKLSPYLSIIEYCILKIKNNISYLLHLPRIILSKLFRLIMGINYRAYLENKRKAL